MLVIPLVLLGFQGYRVLEAIGEAQGVAVVPLPTRGPRDDGAALRLSPGTRSPAAGPRSTVAPAPALTEPTWSASDPTAPGDDGTAGPSGTALAAAPAVAPTPTSAPPHVVEDTGEPAVVAANTVPDDTGDGDEDVSAFDVLRELTTAGGDPLDDEVWGGREAVTILVLGVDRRAGGGDQNADVIIIARLDLREQTVQAVGLPRDLLVDIPGHGPGKINGAYNLGVAADPGDPVAGVALVRDTVEDAFGVTIDHYVLVDFAGFERVVDAVGGVELTVPTRIVDEAYPTEDQGTEVVVFEPGLEHMDGERALKYARTRNADSDDQRRERQFQLLIALFDEGKRLGSLPRAADIILALGGAVQTSFPLNAQISLARLGLDMDRSDIILTGVGQPLVEPGWTDDGAWVYVGDPVAVAAFVRDGLGLAG